MQILEREGEREAQKEQILWTRTISLIPLPLNITIVRSNSKWHGILSRFIQVQEIVNLHYLTES